MCRIVGHCRCMDKRTCCWCSAPKAEEHHEESFTPVQSVKVTGRLNVPAEHVTFRTVQGKALDRVFRGTNDGDEKNAASVTEEDPAGPGA